MKTEINPLSAYDIKYIGMSKEDREKIESDVAKVLANSVPQATERLKEKFRELADEVYSNVICNPWPDFIAENGNSYHFIEALANHIWQSLIKAKPSRLGEWKMREIFSAMAKNHPEDLKAICDAELMKENARLQELCDFNERFNQSRGY